MRCAWSSPISGTLRCQARRPFPRCWTISLPDAPAEKALLVAAAEANVAGQLRELLHQGMESTRQPGWRRSASRARQRSRPALVPGQRTRSRRRWEPALAPAAEPTRWTRRSLRSSTLTRAHGPRAKLTSACPARRRSALGCLAGTGDDGLAGVRECGAPRRSVPPADSPRGTPRVRRSSRIAERRSRRAARRPGRQRPGASGEDAPTPPRHLVSRRDRVPPRLEDTGRRRARRQRASRPYYPAHRKTAPRKVAQRPPLPPPPG